MHVTGSPGLLICVGVLMIIAGFAVPVLIPIGIFNLIMGIIALTK